MVKKSYAVMNLSYRDSSREEDYLLTRVRGKSTFHIPLKMRESQMMYPSEPIEMICLETLEELKNDFYTKEEFDNLINDLILDVERHLVDVFAAGPNITDAVRVPVNDEKLLFDFLPIL